MKKQEHDDPLVFNNIKLKPAENKRLEKAYSIIESSLIEPMMIVELENGTDSAADGKVNNQQQNKTKRRLFRVRSSLKEKNKYYDVDIENKTCTCADFNFRQNKCKHIVAMELYLY